jgi:uncharacterized protein
MRVIIIVHPNSKRPRFEKDLLGCFHAYVSQPPLQGKANRAVIEVLAKHFKVSKSKIKLIQGEKFKQKVFEIDK